MSEQIKELNTFSQKSKDKELKSKIQSITRAMVATRRQNRFDKQQPQTRN